MNEQEIKSTILELIGKIAPDADTGTLSESENFRTTLGLDSFDFLQLMIAVSNQFSIEIPEQDYVEASSLKGLTGYILSKQS